MSYSMKAGPRINEVEEKSTVDKTRAAFTAALDKAVISKKISSKITPVRKIQPRPILPKPIMPRQEIVNSTQNVVPLTLVPIFPGIRVIPQPEISTIIPKVENTEPTNQEEVDPLALENPIKVEIKQEPDTEETSSEPTIVTLVEPVTWRDGKPFCEICQKTFRKVSELREHERIHTGENPSNVSIVAKPS